VAVSVWLGVADNVRRVSLTWRWLVGWAMVSIERTAYPRFKRFMSVRELPVFYTRSRRLNLIP
jgi:hypothetical protein